MTPKDLALTLVIKAHAGQLDKAGAPYLDHVLAVAASFAEDDMRHVSALLHDIVEDTTMELEDLRGYGFPNEVLVAVDCLTKREDVPYEAYILQIKANPIARDIKIADLRHNSQLTRLKNITPADLTRYKKYKEALALLTSSYH